MTALTISKNAQAAIQINQWIRNGRPVLADLQNRLATAMGYAIKVTQRCIFSYDCGLITTADTSAIPDSLASRSRWRHAWHTDPYASFLYVQFEIAPENGGGATDPYCTYGVRNSAGSLIGTATMHWGSSDGSYADVPINFGGGRAVLRDGSGAFVFITPDEDHTAVFSDVGTARLFGATVWEVAVQPDTANGYPANNFGGGAPIYFDQRSDIITAARQIRARGAAVLWNWHSEIDSSARASSSGTLKNVVDDSSTSVSTTTPGATLDMRNKTTMNRAASGVPVIMKVAASSTSAADTGTVVLKDSTGTAVITASITGTTEAWYLVPGHLPATLAKYDLHYGGATSGTLTVFAVSIYEYDGYGDDIDVTASDPADIRIRAFDGVASLT